MPRKRRLAKSRLGWTDDHRDYLIRGWTFPDSQLTDAEARAAWEVLRDGLLPEFIAENPGRRPWAWWAFDAPGPRRRIDGRPHPFKNPERRKHYQRLGFSDAEANDTHFGLPNSLFPPQVCDDFDAEYESELDYL